jgi:hypothetical protein
VSDIRSVQGGCSRFSRCCYLISVLCSHLSGGSWAPGVSRSHLDSAVGLGCPDRNSKPLPASPSDYCARVRKPLRPPTTDGAVPPAFAPRPLPFASWHFFLLARQASAPISADHCLPQTAPECSALCSTTSPVFVPSSACGQPQDRRIVNRLCKFLGIALSRTHERLIYMVLVLLGLWMSRERFPHPIVGLSPWPTLCRAWAVLGLLGLRLARQRPGAGPDPNHPLSCSLSHGSVAGQRRGYFFDRLVVRFDGGASQELMVSDRISSRGRN